MVVCDNVIQDPSTKKFSMLGTFDMMSAAEFPTTARISIYLILTDCLGKYSLELKLSAASPDSTDDEDIVGVKFEIDAPDPLEIIQMGTEFRGPIPRPGLYYLQLCEENEGCLIERRLLVTTTDPQPHS